MLSAYIFAQIYTYTYMFAKLISMAYNMYVPEWSMKGGPAEHNSD